MTSNAPRTISGKVAIFFLISFLSKRLPIRLVAGSIVFDFFIVNSSFPSLPALFPL